MLTQQPRLHGSNTQRIPIQLPIQDAPYLLEPFVENWSSEDPTVRLALLTAACQLFFRRPPEAKALLGAALAAGVSDSHSDVRDRSLLYYRCGALPSHEIVGSAVVVPEYDHTVCGADKAPELMALWCVAYQSACGTSALSAWIPAACDPRLLRADPAAAERVVAPPLMTVPWFSESLTPEARDTIFAEFNSLSVLFQQVRGGGALTLNGLPVAYCCGLSA